MVDKRLGMRGGSGEEKAWGSGEIYGGTWPSTDGGACQSILVISHVPVTLPSSQSSKGEKELGWAQVNRHVYVKM